MRILLIEDDRDIGEGLTMALKRHGHAVDWFTDGKQGLIAVDSVDFDLAILDLGLPTVDGIDILANWRSRQIDLPVLILTARNALPDRVKGLNIGADDYLGKPFDTEELIARLSALLRRQHGHADNSLCFGNLSLNSTTKTVTLNGELVTLRSKEFTLLEMFMSQPTHIISREQIEDKLYSWDSDVDSNAIQVYIHALRKKFGKAFIKTQRGLGYQLGDKP
ncbi:response regulator [Psychrobacter sp. HD31]|uniref:response regulator n=1 Tax=Psychrobacter sp. HD31 TaxID=3112003 RepID=UPI003DA37CE9